MNANQFYQRNPGCKRIAIVAFVLLDLCILCFCLFMLWPTAGGG